MNTDVSDELPALLVRRPACFAPGIFREMPAEDYFEIEAMSASGAKKMLLSPAHYKLMRDQPLEPTAEMQVGTAVHCGVLEPDTFAMRIACAPDCDKRTKSGKEEWTAFATTNAGRIILSPDDFARARRCIDATRAHPAAAQLLLSAEIEISLFWRDGRYDVPCKARLDARNHGGIIDLKTTRDASPDGFARQIANLLYHVQGAHYFSGVEHVLNETPAFFAFIAVENEPPHAVACYSLPGNAVLAGAHLMNRALERYRDALAAGAWPGYPDTIQQIMLPKWATIFNV
jgi:PDDEXK-like domain of unknown function (DUF3799)